MTRGFIRPVFWLLLALPGLLMLTGVLRGEAIAKDLLHPTGEFSVRLMLAAMMAGPLAGIFGSNRFFNGWLRLRRNLGVAAFGYAFLHLVFYLIDVGAIPGIVEELAQPSIWTGWLALFVMLAPAVISNNAAMRVLGWVKWKSIQRLTYLAMALSLIHWLLLEWKWQPALAHLIPLVTAWLVLALIRFRKPQQKGL